MNKKRRGRRDCDLESWDLFIDSVYEYFNKEARLRLNNGTKSYCRELYWVFSDG